jgi:ribosomal protein S18 acetylase RimI-like enzyme
VSEPGEIRFRSARPDDGPAIAWLHADSWRRHYRGAYSDAYLDGNIIDERTAAWTARMEDPDPMARTVVAENGASLVGFVHVQLEDDPVWGALVDNLHVRADTKRSGIGRRLMSQAARAVIADTPASGLYLWVLEQNVAARAFYTAEGGQCVERITDLPPDQDPGMFNGTPACLRMAWPDPARLLVAD